METHKLYICNKMLKQNGAVSALSVTLLYGCISLMGGTKRPNLSPPMAKRYYKNGSYLVDSGSLSGQKMMMVTQMNLTTE